MDTPVNSPAVTARRISTIDTAPTDCTSELIEEAGGRRFLYWRGPRRWLHQVRSLLNEGDLEAIPSLVGPLDDDQNPGLILACAGEEVGPFDLWKWRNLPNLEAVAALQVLAATVGVIHGAGFTLGGLERGQLLYCPRRRHLLLGSLHGLRPLDGERETIWRDLRLFGELAYENFLEHEYPGGHQLVTLLQEPAAMAETGIVFPGLPQLLAGCVTPYGDLAYGSTDDLLHGLGNLRTELTRPVTYRVGARSTQGNHIFRQNNQDSCAHVVVETTCGSQTMGLGFFCVADGIGGIDDGERASSLAVRTACAAFLRAWNHYDGQTLYDHPTEVARSIAQVTSQRLALDGDFNPDQNRGGTTFTGVFLAGDRLGLCHVGDSRAFLLRDGQLIPLTEDHTLAAILERLGEPTGGKDDASHRTIARFLSTGSELEWRRIDGITAEASSRLGLTNPSRRDRGIDLRPGDMVLLTSDGAHGEVDNDELRRLGRRFCDEPQGLCQAIVDQALQNIGRDNATALAVLIEAAPSSLRL